MNIDTSLGKPAFSTACWARRCVLCSTPFVRHDPNRPPCRFLPRSATIGRPPCRPEVCRNAALARPRQQLLAGLLAGEPAAVSLTGLLLVFPAASAEKMPMLLRDIGAAYYRWQPRTSDRPGEMEHSWPRGYRGRVKTPG